MARQPWIWWLVPLALHCGDALAWGLATHLYFAQHLLWAVPLLDPKLRQAARRLPRLVLAGACLPDLVLVAGRRAARCFADSHDWTRARRLLACADSDEERAVSLGYASHLFVDVIAHNHFVPAHEAMWLKLPLMTHAVAEWVMDAHLARQLFARPEGVLPAERDCLVPYLGRHFGCPEGEAHRALMRLAAASRLLYGSRLHRGLRAAAGVLDRRLAARCDHYVAETAARLPQINRLLAGEAPNWRADLPCPQRTRHLRTLSGEELRGPLPLPGSLFG